MTLYEAGKRKIEEDEKHRSDIKGKFSPSFEARTTRSRVVAALLAIFLGWIGIHKFYLGKPVQGFIYILFSWTAVPAIIGIIEGIIYLSMSDQDFKSKYP